jgi:azurin
VNESGISHNVVFLKNAKDLDEIGDASAAAAATGFVPMQHKAKLFGYSPLATAGKTVEFIITVPPVGEYLFACFVDGHHNVMIGKLISYKAAEKE